MAVVGRLQIVLLSGLLMICKCQKHGGFGDQFIGCFKDTRTRALPKNIGAAAEFGGSGFSNGKCIRGCSGNGYTFAGTQPCETSNISICEGLSKLEARMAANENLCAENNCCIAGKSPARPSTERRISQPATHHHNDANKTHEWTTQNQRSLKTQEQRPGFLRANLLNSHRFTLIDYNAQGVSGMPERREFIGGRFFGNRVAFLWHRSLAASTKIIKYENNRLCAKYITMDTTKVLLVNAYTFHVIIIRRLPSTPNTKPPLTLYCMCLWIESDADVVILDGDLNTDQRYSIAWIGRSQKNRSKFAKFITHQIRRLFISG
ncbi:hypothetical protein CAPTEDRAFT_202912 [Capitella teleta]|uniref:Uncharacterized protein n=1 Tax=Capitella teleta TaxID=283909 RepID=R7U2Y7_CAPTE|nr:hypothetical protein CAPTEDRAFT_202912 [Capitella teleta]|eukprot:ELT97545.1 hypothetical protein CAPTEDRAFT_202912 [Capitella teleta]